MYRQIGVRLWGEGAYEREPVDGGATQYATLFETRAGDIVINKIWARNGSVAVVDDRLAGSFGSGEFPMFSPTPTLLPRWAHWLTKWRPFWDQCAEKSQGTSGQNRIKPERFLDIAIPLPPLPEQQRIVARIDELSSLLQGATVLRLEASAALAILRARVQQSIFSGMPTGRVSDFVRFQTGYAFKSEWFADVGVRLARNANIGHGRLNWADTVRIPAVRRTEFPAFELGEGDILLALDRPLISTGVKVARVIPSDLPALLLQRVARARFVDDRLSPSYFFRWLQSPLFASSIDPGRSNGIPHISHKDVESLPIHVPPLADQRRIVCSLEAAGGEIQAVEHVQSQTRTELDALLPAILDRAFAGAL